MLRAVIVQRGSVAEGGLVIALAAGLARWALAVAAPHLTAPGCDGLLHRDEKFFESAFRAAAGASVALPLARLEAGTVTVETHQSQWLFALQLFA
jgi:hypothetical protein